MNYTPDFSKLYVCGGYYAIKCPDHPKAWKTGLIHLHRIIAEQKIGRLLLPGEVVHHIDKNKFNNLPENLEVLTQAEHKKRHDEEYYKFSVNLICDNCKKRYSVRRGQEPDKKGYKHSFCSRKCNGVYQSKAGKLLFGGFKKEVVLKHGTKNCYSHRRCRCRKCKDAIRDYARKYRK